MKAKEYLERIEEIETQIRLLNAEKKKEAELTLDNATSISSRLSEDKIQSSGDLQRMESTIVDGVDKENDYDKRIEELKAERQKIIDLIFKLPAFSCDIIYRRYVEKQSLKEIAFILGKSYATVQTGHVKALESFEMLLKYEEI